MSMEAKIAVCLHDMKESHQPTALRPSGNGVSFTCPPALKDANCPANDTTFNVEQLLEQPTAANIQQRAMPNYASDFVKNRQNLVAFSYGVRSTPKRQLMFGSRTEEGYAAKVISDAVSGAQGIFSISCFIIGMDEHLPDLIKADNELGCIVESVKEGPRVRMVERVKVTSPADVRNVFTKIVQNYEKYFEAVLPEKQPTAELQALPPYRGESIMLQLFR